MPGYAALTLDGRAGRKSRDGGGQELGVTDLAPETVERKLRGRFGRPYVFLTSCASTQLELTDEAGEGAVVAADEQTAGRGRLGRRWLAPPGTSLLVSIALTPTAPPERLPELSPLGAHALAAAIRSITGLRPEVKFPNDVLIRGRKVAGVLGEARSGRVALGFGVNVNVPAGELPGDADTPPTSLLLETGGPVDRGELLAALLAELERRYDAWSAQP